MDKINIVIADDHSIMRQGIKQIVELEENIKVIGEASNGEEALNKILSLKPDVALLDINMPILNGIQVAKKLRESDSSTKVIILTIHSDKEYLMEAIQHGAVGYVLKDAESTILIEAIQKAHNGESYIPSNIATELIKGYGKESESKEVKKLTDREYEVLRTISQGLSNKEIASQLYISEKTVKNHVTSIFRKLNISDRTQAAIYAIKNGIK